MSECVGACYEPPNPVVNGLWLCASCIDNLGSDAVAAADLHHELLDAMTPGANGLRESVSSTPERGLSVDDRVMNARTQIVETLRSWSVFVAGGLGFPGEDPWETSLGEMADFIARNRMWLAKSEHAGAASHAFRECAWGEPWRVARPSGMRVQRLGPCPIEDCPGNARAALRHAASLLASHIECSTGAHRWEPYEWLDAFPSRVTSAATVDTDMAALILGVSPASVRQFASKGRLLNVGREGSPEYRLRAVHELRGELWPSNR